MVSFIATCKRVLICGLTVVGWGGTLLGWGGCLFDGDHPCGLNQTFDQRTFSCLCNKGFALSAEGKACVACGAHEVASDLKCVCQQGFVRDPRTQQCQQTKLGSPCHPTQSPCVDPKFHFCHTVGAAAEGYCTATGCAAVEDCQEGYTCDTQGRPSFCRRPPTGQGEHCETPQDCQAFDASYCEPNTRKCLVINCVMDDPAACSTGWGCCDLSQLLLEDLPQTICAPEDTIPTLKVYGARCQGD